jgi:hypothetical protein
MPAAEGSEDTDEIYLREGGHVMYLYLNAANRAEVMTQVANLTGEFHGVMGVVLVNT